MRPQTIYNMAARVEFFPNYIRKEIAAMAGKISKTSAASTAKSKSASAKPSADARGRTAKSSKPSKPSEKSKGMSTGAKVAVGVAAGAAVVGAAAAALAGTEGGRKLVKKATDAAKSAAGEASHAIKAGEQKLAARMRGAIDDSTKSGTKSQVAPQPAIGKPAKPVTLVAGSRAGLGGFSLGGGGAFGGASMGGGIAGAPGSVNKPSSATGFGKGTSPKVSARVAQLEATRGAVRGRSGHR